MSSYIKRRLLVTSEESPEGQVVMRRSTTHQFYRLNCPKCRLKCHVPARKNSKNMLILELLRNMRQLDDEEDDKSDDTDESFQCTCEKERDVPKRRYSV